MYTSQTRTRTRLVKRYLICLIIKTRIIFGFKVLVKIICRVKVQICKYLFEIRTIRSKSSFTNVRGTVEIKLRPVFFFVKSQNAHVKSWLLAPYFKCLIIRWGFWGLK